MENQETKIEDFGNLINQQAPVFNQEAFMTESNETKSISLSDYDGKWIVLFFYPADFTFVCPTELGDLADNYERFKETLLSQGVRMGLAG